MAEEKPMVEEEDTEEETSSDKTEENENEDEGEEESEDKTKEKTKEELKRSEIAQKIKYREKYKQASSKVTQLEAELTKLKGMDKDIGKKPADDAEARAQEYIRSQAKAVYEDLLNARKTEEEKVTRQFEEKVEEILEENPEVSEKELLNAIEDYEVAPDVALKILKRTSNKKEKPKMPQAKRASTESEPETKGKADDSNKSMWQIAREEMAKLKK